MSERNELERLQHDIERHVAIAAEQATELARLRAEVERLTAEQDAVSVAIGTNEYMDPPDGGNVSLAEQVRRMRDALLARVEAAEARVSTASHGGRSNERARPRVRCDCADGSLQGLRE